MKYNVWLAQVNFVYGESSIFLPYSVGMLEAYARGQAEIGESFSFKGYIYRREPISDVVERIEQSGGVDVFGISAYIWNEQYSRALAAAIRDRWPACLIVIGGPHVHARENPFVIWAMADIAVRGEGELAFASILRAYGARGVQQHQGPILRGHEHVDVYGSIAGLAIQSDNGTVYTGEPQRITDLAGLRSPYLDGCFDTLLADRTIDWQACSETHRGCPYSCTFCDWGSATLSKIRQFSDSRIIDEYEWFGRNGIRYLYNCDANYGLLARDVDLTRVLVETKKLFSFPQEFRACYAKNSNDRVFEIAKMLNESQMSKGVTLSFQSMDAHTQETIRRKNIKLDHFRETLQRYRQAGIVTYTELIIGLPGETLESFKDGINTLLNAGQHDGINMYLCQTLPNSEMNDVAYRAAHEIVDRRSPLLLQHSSPAVDPHQEYNDIVLGTSTMDAERFCETYKFAWAVQTFHCLGLARYLSMFCAQELGMPYSVFYSALMAWASDNLDSYLGQEYLQMCRVIDRGMRGGDWGQVDQRFGNIIWPTEEMSFLRIMADIVAVEKDLKRFLMLLMAKCNYSITPSLLNNLIDYQTRMMIRPDDSEGRTIETDYNCHSYFTSILKGNPIKFMVQSESVLVIPRRVYASLEEYARIVCWWGRKGGRFTQSNVIHYSKE